MNIHTHTRCITRTFGITLVAGALAVASAVTAQAAVNWELVGGQQIWLTNDNKGACVQSGSWFTAQPGAQINTLVFHNNGRCTDGAGQQCRSTVPAGPSMGYWRFDATTCKWTNIVTEPVRV